MANPGSIIIRVIVAGAQIFGRAFVDAYQAAKLKSHNSRISSESLRAKGIQRRTAITPGEAARILGIDEKVGIAELRKRSEDLYKRNDPQKGGSPYIQAKIQAAQTCIEDQIKERVYEQNKNSKN